MNRKIILTNKSAKTIQHISYIKGARSIQSYFTIITVSILIAFLTACSESKVVKETEHLAPVPIQEIREQLNLPIALAVDALYLVLSRHNLELPDGIARDGSFSSSSIRIKDTMCEGKYLNKAPVSCEVKINGQILQAGNNKSSLTLRYQEHCLEQRHIPVVCKDSNAEKLLFSIHREIKKQR
ncbi:MAG TPA: hypothetical protein PKA63_08230 [Oligoflexia bacterium]|nr:hypothetical protein [Oligoflexia bacterium]HMP48638.1 hypothetical protein [Oligoflexia bacterium]